MNALDESFKPCLGSSSAESYPFTVILSLKTKRTKRDIFLGKDSEIEPFSSIPVHP